MQTLSSKYPVSYFVPLISVKKINVKRAYFVSYSNVIYHFVRCRQHQAR
ncbi:hypothetical protein AB08_1486 [Escherichia coli 5-366-08_S1_C1]|nr:hypothetical protein PPECC33_02155 [Escherichia coli PCN033]EIH14972.1 hypothetical protein EC990741_2141 [Escherichia coli 97.0259]KEJ75177.1 hypothetical protein AB67_2271 [Escherichia coli 5-366-08_S1_C3]KEL70757.1 hypothetical protein AB08_1486 [Escherichia coli 5-366-08_S1_C1]RCH08506.1 hypothetical protein CSC37_0134 [Escherichia coli]